MSQFDQLVLCLGYVSGTLTLPDHRATLIELLRSEPGGEYTAAHLMNLRACITDVLQASGRQAVSQ